MSNLSFARDLQKEFDAIIERGNKQVIQVTKGMYKVAVNATPRDTGRAKNGWKLNTGQRSGLIPAMGHYGEPTVPDFKFDFKKEPIIHLYNNVPYISFLENGQGNGHRFPYKMLWRAEAYYNANMQRALDSV